MSDPAPAREPRQDLAERLFDWLARLRGRSGESLRESVEELLAEPREGEDRAELEERTLLRNVLAAGEQRVEDVMVPRADIVALEEDAGLPEVIRVFLDGQHSRLPVYRNTLDEVLGFVHVKDLLPFWGGGRDFRLAGVLRKCLFVPPSMPVLDLLRQMRARRVHMALVVDEYGGTDGLVTIEDLVEQIVGEIDDEHDEAEVPLLLERPDGTLEAAARCPVEALERRIGARLLDDERDEDIETLGGLVVSLLGRVPRKGEVVPHPLGLEFEVMEADPRRIKRLRIRKLQAAQRPAAS